MPKQTSRQRRAVDRGEYRKYSFLGFTFNSPPRRWNIGMSVYGNRNRQEWPWPRLIHVDRKVCEPVPCPPFEDAHFVDWEHLRHDL